MKWIPLEMDSDGLCVKENGGVTYERLWVCTVRLRWKAEKLLQTRLSYFKKKARKTLSIKIQGHVFTTSRSMEV